MRTIENKSRKTTAFKILALASTALVGLALPCAAQAQQWAGPISSNWFDSTNWNPAQIPTSGDDVMIDNASGFIPRVSGTGKDAHANHIVIGDTQDNTLNLENGATLTSSGAVLGNQTGSSGAVNFGSPPSAALTYWTNNGSVIIGNSGHGALTISQGTVNNTEAVIAANAGGSGFVGVSGPTGVWNNNGGLTVGNGGTGTLFISSGGLITSNRGFLGFNTGSNGTMTVDGAGSTWTNTDFVYVGANGTASLTISNGGKVQNTDASIGAGNGSGTVNVVGTGSTWINGGALNVGHTSTGALNITNGGTVSSVAGTIGVISGSTGTVSLDGAGSTWSNSGGLTVGNNGTGTLDVTHGGLVTSNRGFIGFGTGSNGTMTVDGAGSTWTNTDFVYVGANGTASLSVSNGGKVQNTDASIGAGNGSGTVGVTGTGSAWSNSGALNIGHVSTGTLNISNGGKVDSNGGYIGRLGGANGTVTVDGAGSAWTSSDRLNVGHFGDGSLTISNGGAVSAFNASVAYGGGNTGAVTVTGGGSIWSVIADIAIGDSGTGTLMIQNGGTVVNDLGTIGFEAGSSGTVTVDGAGSKWSNHGRLAIGESGGGTLNIAGGGKVDSNGGYIGRLGGANGTVTVDGAGSAWTSSDRLNVGHFGNGSLTISNGGAVSAFNASVAYGGGNTGAVTVTGAGSIWSIIADAAIGDSGTGTLTIQNGGTVANASGTVGLEAGSSGTVTVDGTGSTWTNNGSLYLGYDGSGALNVANGGVVHAGFTALGSAVGSDGAMTVDGNGSGFAGTGNLTIGSVGSGTLAIAHGGMVDNLVGTIGANAGAIGTVTVDGPGSAWNNDGFLRVGDGGTGVLYVRGGGTVHDFAGILASTGIASAGHVFVDGPASTWINDAATVIGLSGTARLDITNGGLVIGGNGTIGSAANSQALAIVQDAGSAWNVSGDLTVGNFGNGQLVIAGGGTVTVGGTLRLAENAGSRGDLNIGGNVAPGTLDAATVQFGAGIGRINFSHTGTNYSFDSAINGLGTINQSTGVTRLTADSGSFTGATLVTGGTLLVDGKLGTGAVDVQTGGTLGGVGMIGGAVTIAAGGTLSGIQGQALTLHDLVLAGGANVDVRLSTPAGAALFDVVNDLTLDGMLNIASAGSLGPGVYSLMTYGGALTDNGLDIGTTPGGTVASDFAVQTSVAGQVNLIDTALPKLSFWDGDAVGSAGNNAVDGGSGVWSVASTNWTDLAGMTNGVMNPQPGFVIFQGTAGVVTIDAGPGDIAVTGMQFAGSGYRLTGAPVTLADANSIFRVGDGSAAGTDFTATIGSVLTGAGGLNKADLGTLILTADNNYGGGTTITGGTLQLGSGGTSGSVAGNIVDNGALVFNRSDAITYAGAISGAGGITQNGAGTVNLTGNSSGFIGTVNIRRGRLAVNGALAGGKVTVGNGGTLAGNGIIGSVTAQSGSIVAPGNSIGTLNVAGNASFAAGSNYQVELTTGQSDLINVSGTATIAKGAQLSIVKIDAAPYVLGTHYTILTAAGGVNGSYIFSSIPLTNFISLVAGSDAQTIFLDVAKTKTFASAGMTANEIATGGGIDSLPLTNGLVSVVANLPTDAAAQGAFNQLSGEIHASARGAMIEDSRFVREAVMDRLRGTFGAMPEAGDGRVSAWGRAFGSRGRMHGDGNVAAIKHDDSGYVMGVDGMVGEDWRIGFVGGYSHSIFRAAVRHSSGESDDYHIGIYGGTQQDNLTFRSGLAYTLHELSTTRTVTFAGFSDAPRGDYNARTVQTFGELGYALQAGKLTFEPFANLAYVGHSTDGFAEKGGAATLSGKGDKADITFTTLGLRGASGFSVDGDTTVKVRGTLGWRHAFDDMTPETTLAFPGGSPFSIGGVPIASDAAMLELGMDMNVSKDATLGFSYGGQFGSGSSGHSFRANFAVKF
jgi:fibronectin-binding autotransporter adhesin